MSSFMSLTSRAPSPSYYYGSLSEILIRPLKSLAVMEEFYGGSMEYYEEEEEEQEIGVLLHLDLRQLDSALFYVFQIYLVALC